MTALTAHLRNKNSLLQVKGTGMQAETLQYGVSFNDLWSSCVCVHLRTTIETTDTCIAMMLHSLRNDRNDATEYLHDQVANTV